MTPLPDATPDLFTKRGEGKCKIRDSDRWLESQTPGREYVGKSVGGGGERAEGRVRAPDLTILRPRGTPPMEKLRSEYSTLFFWPENRSSSKFPKHPGGPLVPPPSPLLLLPSPPPVHRNTLLAFAVCSPYTNITYRLLTVLTRASASRV